MASDGYREPDQRARIEDLESELDDARKKIDALKTSRKSPVLAWIRSRSFRFQSTYLYVCIGILAVTGGVVYLISLPPRPTHRHVLFAGKPALETQCNVRQECLDEAKNECRGAYQELDFQEKRWVENVCTMICTGDSKTTMCVPNCWPEHRYAAWVTYRCEPEAVQ